MRWIKRVCLSFACSLFKNSKNVIRQIIISWHSLLYIVNWMNVRWILMFYMKLWTKKKKFSSLTVDLKLDLTKLIYCTTQPGSHNFSCLVFVFIFMKSFPVQNFGRKTVKFLYILQSAVLVWKKLWIFKLFVQTTSFLPM